MRVWLVVATLLLAGPALANGDAGHPKRDARTKPSEETAIGSAADPKKATRTVRVSMADNMRFTPSELTIERGETVKFIVRNNGKLMHEFVIGTMTALKEHAQMMKQEQGMEHDEPYMAHVAPGKTATIIWQFTRAGEIHFGCLVPGHFEVGMVGRIKVLAKGEGK